VVQPVSWRQFRESDGSEDWRNLSDSACAMFRTASFAEGAAFVSAIAALPEVADHAPSIDIRPDGVVVQLLTVTDTYEGLSAIDLALARRISALARDHGIVADPSAVQSVLLIPGAEAPENILAFWRAVLGYEAASGGGDPVLVDPHRRGPSLWVERMKEPRPDGGAFHIAIWVPSEHADARVASALAAGGTMVRDRGPAWWTLADAAGNEVDIATTMGRD
jgi:4a-hydroxytetrahydrobiopterin dehydratase